MRAARRAARVFKRVPVLGDISPFWVSEGGLEHPSPPGAQPQTFPVLRAREGGMAADCPRKSGKSQGRYPTLPVPTGHNTHGCFVAIQFYLTNFTAYCEISDRLTLHQAEILDKTKVLHSHGPPARPG
jgi:hypothetical protein